MRTAVGMMERLRRVWTPEREVEELVYGSLDPQSALDSMIRDMFSRIVHQKGPITVKGGGGLGEPTPGNIRWETVMTPQGPETTIWWVP